MPYLWQSNHVPCHKFEYCEHSWCIILAISSIIYQQLISNFNNNDHKYQLNINVCQKLICCSYKCSVTTCSDRDYYVIMWQIKNLRFEFTYRQISGAINAVKLLSHKVESLWVIRQEYTTSTFLFNKRWSCCIAYENRC